MTKRGRIDADESGYRGVVVFNPTAGNEDHASQVRELAAEYGFDVVESEYEDHAVELARRAVEEGATFVLACGGDGTLNEVIRGVDRAGGLDDVTIAVLPAGTGNNFAKNVGVGSLREGFDVAVDGERRRIDLGEVETPDGETRPFVNSCVAGLTAESSAATDPDAKSRLGVVAYVVETLRALDSFESLDLRITTGDGDVREFEAVILLVGNGRRFPAKGTAQANMEDGKLDVTVIEGTSGLDLAGGAAAARLFGDENASLERLRTPELHVQVAGGGRTTFSLDGEMVETEELTIRTRPSALNLCVGERYDPNPE